MLSVKINKKNHISNNLEKTIQHLVGFIHQKMNLNAKVISDNETAEINFGNQEVADDEYIVAELTMRKNIKIKKSDFENRDKLHGFISTIKNFCEKAYEVETFFESKDFTKK